MDKPAFELVYKQNYDRILFYCLRMTHDLASAEDFTQSAFLQAFKNWHRFRGDSAVSTWLTRIAFNEVLMGKRRRACRPECQMELTVEGEPIHMASVSDPIVESTPERVDIQNALVKLGSKAPRQETVIRLHYMHGYQHREIAKILGITVGGSKSQGFRAEVKMKQYLTRSEGK